jgi:hypothetical protein
VGCENIPKIHPIEFSARPIAARKNSVVHSGEAFDFKRCEEVSAMLWPGVREEWER